MELVAGNLYEVDIAGENALPYIGRAYANHVSEDTRPDGNRSVALIIVTGGESVNYKDTVLCVTVNSKCLLKDLGAVRIAYVS